MNGKWQNWLEGAIEAIDVSARPCDRCGTRGSTKAYADGHIFVLCAECAWSITAEYHARNECAPWEPA